MSPRLVRNTSQGGVKERAGRVLSVVCGLLSFKELKLHIEINDPITGGKLFVEVSATSDESGPKYEAVMPPYGHRKKFQGDLTPVRLQAAIEFEYLTSLDYSDQVIYARSISDSAINQAQVNSTNVRFHQSVLGCVKNHLGEIVAYRDPAGIFTGLGKISTDVGKLKNREGANDGQNMSTRSGVLREEHMDRQEFWNWTGSSTRFVARLLDFACSEEGQAAFDKYVSTEENEANLSIDTHRFPLTGIVHTPDGSGAGHFDLPKELAFLAQLSRMYQEHMNKA